MIITSLIVIMVLLILVLVLGMVRRSDDRLMTTMEEFEERRAKERASFGRSRHAERQWRGE